MATKNTKTALLKLLAATRSSVKRDYQHYERLINTTLSEDVKRACNVECDRLFYLLEQIDSLHDVEFSK